MNYFDILLAKKLSGGSPTPPGDTYERKSVTSYPVTDSANYPLPKCDVTVTDADKCEVIVTTDNTITEDSGVYIERQSGGGSRELDAIVGGSIVLNQLVQNGNFANGTTGWNIQNGTLTVDNSIATATATVNGNVSVGRNDYNIPNNHVIFCSATVKGISGKKFIFSSMTNSREFNATGNYQPIEYVEKASTYSIGYPRVLCKALEINDTFDIKYFNIIDLTALFGSTIADYIYTLEQATAGSGIAWLKSYGYLTEDYYGYIANKIESVSVARHITRGVNQWDEQWELGGLNDATGQKFPLNTAIRCKNYISCKPNTNYYYYCAVSGLEFRICYYDKSKNFISCEAVVSINRAYQTPTNCYYIMFSMRDTYGTTYNHDISINYPATATAYEPYHEPHTYPINPITLRGIPKLNASNQLYYDGDRYEASGRVTRKYGVVDLGSLAWGYTNGRFITDNYITDIKAPSSNFVAANILTDRYLTSTANNTESAENDKIVAINRYSNICIRDSAYNDATAFKTAMNGVYLVYEKATPTYEDSSPFETNQIVDANGTEEYIDAGVEAGTRDVAIPVGHDTKYFNGKAYVKPLTAGTSDTVSMADMGIMPTSPMYISANGEIDAEYWKQVE